MGAVAGHVHRGQLLLRGAVAGRNVAQEVVGEVVRAQDLGVAGGAVEGRTGSGALLALADEGLAVGLEHGDLAVRGAVGHADDGRAHEGLDLFAGKEGAVRGVAGVDHTDDDALAGGVLAAELRVPRAVGAAELEEIGAGVIRGVFRVGGHGQDVGVLGELDGLVRGERGAEAVDRGGELALDLDALLARDVRLLLLQVGPVLLDLGLVGVELLALRGFRGRQPGRAALVGGCRLLGQQDDVAAVRVAGGIQILLGDSGDCRSLAGRRGGGRDGNG